MEVRQLVSRDGVTLLPVVCVEGGLVYVYVIGVCMCVACVRGLGCKEELMQRRPGGEAN